MIDNIVKFSNGKYIIRLVNNEYWQLYEEKNGVYGFLNYYYNMEDAFNAMNERRFA